MAHRDQLMKYFGRASAFGDRIGSEIETFFVNDDGNAITIEQSQRIFQELVSRRWKATAHKGNRVTEVRRDGCKALYELGFPNIELAVAPCERREIVTRTRQRLEELYGAAERCGAFPMFAPIFVGNGNYLVLPDDRDETWQAVDGVKALKPLARISAVQFTIDVPFNKAIEMLNRLHIGRGSFLAKYPQDKVWRTYIRVSKAGYKQDRYGGPAEFNDLDHYCAELSRHEVVGDTRLIPFEIANLDSDEKVSLFVRSVWWYFRLRRYGRQLCIEVRPIPRRRDELLRHQLAEVLDIMH